METADFSLYIHIPYCLHKCPYCDFNTYAVNRIPEKEYTNALLAEFDALASSPDWKGSQVRTIYFGGGTPSLFSAESIEKLITTFTEHNRSTPEEVTLEANPGSLTYDYLAALRSLGVTRLSLGAQSFSQKSLTTLGRIHTPEDIELAVAYARDAGFNNINLDLMYGLPEQTITELETDLTRYIALRPEHISAYGLTIEKGTPFYQRYKKGSLILPEENILVGMIEVVNDKLKKQLYERYEISNFARAGFKAVHNMAYWENQNYIGLGAGAHSYRVQDQKREDPVWGRRYANLADPTLYINKTMSTGRAYAWEELLSKSDAIFEMFFLGLRTSTGVSKDSFAKRFQCDPEDVYPGLIEDLHDQKMLEVTPDTIRLTEAGFLLADSIIEHFTHPATTAPRSMHRSQLNTSSS